MELFKSVLDLGQIVRLRGRASEYGDAFWNRAIGSIAPGETFEWTTNPEVKSNENMAYVMLRLDEPEMGNVRVEINRKRRNQMKNGDGIEKINHNRVLTGQKGGTAF